ncbi:MAG: gfo/Idh/MocA family oxidoreductase [Acidobacteria bacterium]|nr:MAG: gfo/Idh/MocA family oxidoreductase [Acidobacteriota bacterium]
MNRTSRRRFFRTTAAGSAGLLLPMFLPRTYLFGAQTPPSRRITVAQIGCGRMGMEDMRGTIKHDLCRIVAVCDLDAKRLARARLEVETHYKGKGESAVDVQTYRDYHEVLARRDIDAVIVTVPDHNHAIVALEAVVAGKDLYVQKPLTYGITEAILLRKAVQAKKRILQTGSQQRSSKPWNTFRVATEAVRNGRIGQVKTVRIGIGQDQPKGKAPAPDPVPAGFDYQRWLGPAPQQPYMEDRVHPQADFDPKLGYGRPGWITTEDFGLGMITNWGAHHVDIAHWGMGMELSGPTSIEARAAFMKGDVWTVHQGYHVEMVYPNGVRLIMDDTYPNGVRFEGTDGWVFCARGAEQVTSSDPAAGQAESKALTASDMRLLNAPLGATAKRWQASADHYRNWLEAIAARRDPIAPVAEAARSLEACAAAWIAMKLGRTLTWDPVKEQFADDAEANTMRLRTPRSAEFDIVQIAKKAGIS